MIHSQKLVSTVEIRKNVRVAANKPLRGQRVCRGSLEKVGLMQERQLILKLIQYDVRILRGIFNNLTYLTNGPHIIINK
jgi:hypothetical protein